GDFKQRVPKFQVPAEALSAIYEPEIECVLKAAHIRGKFGVEALWIIHQVSRMHLEEPCQQHARSIRQVRPRPALDLREIGLADAGPLVLPDCCDDLLLRHLAP